MIALLALGPSGIARAREALEGGLRSRSRGVRHALAAVRLLAPVPRPGRILGVGRNYGAHAAEGGLARQEKPRIFVKLSTSVIGTGTPIRKPRAVAKLDYETELAVVIGTPGRGIAGADALAHVAGYTILNDVSARELQFDVSPPQTSFAKSMDGFCPMGPALATPDEFADVADIPLSCFVNGEEVQSPSTRDMIFPVPALIAYLSAYVTLRPGDVDCDGHARGCRRLPQAAALPRARRCRAHGNPRHRRARESHRVDERGFTTEARRTRRSEEDKIFLSPCSPCLRGENLSLAWRGVAGGVRCAEARRIAEHLAAPHQAVLVRLVAARRHMDGRNVVPHEDVADPPLVAVLELRSGLELEEEVEELAALGRRQARDLDGIAGIGVGCFRPVKGWRTTKGWRTGGLEAFCASLSGGRGEPFARIM